MTTVFERVRLTVGLAHAAPGAALAIDTVHGDRLTAHHGADADLSICDMRRSVISSAQLGRHDRAWNGTTMTIGGHLERDRADIHRRDDGPVEHWFATLLHPNHVYERIESLDAEPETDEHVEVVLKPDPALGVTLIAVRATDEGTENDVRVAAERVWVACLADELAYGATRPASTPSGSFTIERGPNR